MNASADEIQAKIMTRSAVTIFVCHDLENFDFGIYFVYYYIPHPKNVNMFP